MGAPKDIHIEFRIYLGLAGVKLSDEQMVAATLFLQNYQGRESVWLRARRSGASFLFHHLEQFFKTHQIHP